MLLYSVPNNAACISNLFETVTNGRKKQNKKKERKYNNAKVDQIAGAEKIMTLEALHRFM